MKHANCQYCKLNFIVKPGSYGKFCSLSCGTRFRCESNKEERVTNYNKTPAKCINCSKPLNYEIRKNKFCSHSCSASYVNLTRTVKRKYIPKEKVLSCKVNFILCEKTKKWYCNRNQDGNIRKSSPYVKTEKQQYYDKARFRFNIYDYPEEFDLQFIETNGWYTCPGKKRKNLQKNINGVSRDHLISISFGYGNNIDPKLLCHPANCRIVLQAENKKKAENSLITVQELLERIKIWDSKYNGAVYRVRSDDFSLED